MTGSRNFSISSKIGIIYAKLERQELKLGYLKYPENFSYRAKLYPTWGWPDNFGKNSATL